MANQKREDVNFTVFIRLPFARGDFVEWNAVKDQALWDVLSRPSKGDDVDWKALADRFDVTLPFLLQQAAWLYDRQLSKVRAQMRKAGTTHPHATSPPPWSGSGSSALGVQSITRNILNPGAHPPSRPTMLQKDSYSQRGTGYPQRTSSVTSVHAMRGPRDSSQNTTPTVESREPRWEAHDRRPSFKQEQARTALPRESPTLEEEDLSSSSESESDDEDHEVPNTRGPLFKRFGKFSTYKPGMRGDEEDEDDSPAFLPLDRQNGPAPGEPPAQDLNATLRLNAERPGMPRWHTTGRPSIPTNKSLITESSASSASSGVAISRSQTEGPRGASQAGVLSPRRTAELAHRGSRASGKDTSEGTPSMGSSFSDLDDASVTQSALEEALLSNMQRGGMASRMSTISQALRSRYL
ncbi:hypothetical protein MPDQ_005244 [Monascus purpureus]|uniref:Autophagy-related protein 29 n=1 Tax=Monascus purpureus TaxID=5098 RepID=A0A507QZ63_MONPU|nr:hypothetical protein MPDQ_005244 [Monascus purpureus]